MLHPTRQRVVLAAARRAVEASVQNEKEEWAWFERGASQLLILAVKV